MSKIAVKTATGSYPIIFSSDPFAELKAQLSKNQHVAMITDRNLAQVYQKELRQFIQQQSGALITFQATERNKSLPTIAKLADELQKQHFGRNDTVIVALGGGIVGDVVGFLASIYLRGVPYIQVPTTLLAMVDSSIGGKTGVNTEYGKNMLGSFAPPHAVIISPFFLRSLPEHEIRNGLAEMVKHTVLDSRKHFTELSKNIPQILERDESVLFKMIKKSIQVKKCHVEGDEREKSGLRAFLNFGHTIGHAIEKASKYKIPHGQAIAIGMSLESEIAEQELGFQGQKKLVSVFQRCGLPTALPKNITPKDLQKFLIQDKKNVAGRIAYALPKDFGKFTLFQK